MASIYLWDGVPLTEDGKLAISPECCCGSSSSTSASSGSSSSGCPPCHTISASDWSLTGGDTEVTITLPDAACRCWNLSGEICIKWGDSGDWNGGIITTRNEDPCEIVVTFFGPVISAYSGSIDICEEACPCPPVGEAYNCALYYLDADKQLIESDSQDNLAIFLADPTAGWNICLSGVKLIDGFYQWWVCYSIGSSSSAGPSSSSAGPSSSSAGPSSSSAGPSSSSAGPSSSSAGPSSSSAGPSSSSAGPSSSSAGPSSSSAGPSSSSAGPSSSSGLVTGTCASWGCEELSVTYYISEEVARALAPALPPCNGSNCDAASGCYTIAFDPTQAFYKWGIYICKGATSSSAAPSSSSAGPSSSSAGPSSSSAGPSSSSAAPSSSATCAADLCYTVTSAADIENLGGYGKIALWNIPEAYCDCFPEDQEYCISLIINTSCNGDTGCTSYTESGFATEEQAQDKIDDLELGSTPGPWGSSTKVFCSTRIFPLLTTWSFEICWKFADVTVSSVTRVGACDDGAVIEIEGAFSDWFDGYDAPLGTVRICRGDCD